jgi:prophage maintenance system killer protein
MSCVAFLRINGIVLKGEADGYAADFVLALLHGELTLEQAQIWIIDNIRD